MYKARPLLLVLVLANVLAWSVAWAMLADYRALPPPHHLTPGEAVCLAAAGWLECAS